MTEREQNILRNYLAPHARSHWEWTEDASAIVWADSHKTIAFREEIAAVLGRLAPRGLPDFAAIVALMAACRGNWEDAHQHLLSRYSLLDASDSATRGAADLVVATVLPLRIHQDAKTVTEELDRIAQFPPELRQSLEARAVLAEAAFGEADILLEADDAAGIATALRAGAAPDLLIRTSNPDENYGRLVETLEALQRGLPRVDEASIRTRLRTSLDALPRAAEEEIPIPMRARQLMASLRTDTDLAALAQLAMHVLAALQMPRRLNQNDDLPVGGFSDLTNRGTFDRLLISELAQDDLTLTVRVAMNEALYLRREVPAKAAPITRSILLDLGIRMWGLPRVYAVAVALALIASAQEHANVEVLVADERGRDLRPTNLLTREGLLNTLAILHTSAHPGEAIPQLQRRREAIQGVNEAILITHEDVLHDHTFAPLLATAGPLFVATVGREGSLNLYEHSPAGHRRLSEAMLDVSKVLSPPEPTPRLQPVAPAHPDLPAFLQLQPVPLRMPVSRQGVKLAESHRYNLVGVTASRRVLVWDDPQRGARELVSSLPPGRVEAVCVDDELQTAHIVIVNQQESRLGICSIHLDTGVTGMSWIPGNTSEAICYQSGSFLFLHNRSAESLHLATLTRKHRTFEPEYRWINDRYYAGPDGTYAATDSGGSIRLERVSPTPAVGVVRRPDGELGIVTSKLGVVFTRSGNHIQPLPQSHGDGGHVRSGTRGIVAHSRSAGGYLAIEWQPGSTWHRIEGGPSAWLLEPRTKGIEDIPIQKQITNPTALLQKLLGPVVQKFLPDWRTDWRDIPGDAHLRVTRWPDGSRAFADFRGMLHLKSSDSEFPEITLLLTDPIAVWTSDGRAWGQPYHGDVQRLRQEEIAELLTEFLRRLR